MTDNPYGSVITLGGAERKFRLTPVAFRLAKTEHGVQLRAADLATGGLDILSQFLWVGLLPGDPTLKESDVIRWLCEASVEDEMLIFGVVKASAERMYEGMEKILTPTKAGKTASERARPALK